MRNPTERIQAALDAALAPGALDHKTMQLVAMTPALPEKGCKLFAGSFNLLGTPL